MAERSNADSRDQARKRLEGRRPRSATPTRRRTTPANTARRSVAAGQRPRAGAPRADRSARAGSSRSGVRSERATRVSRVPRQAASPQNDQHPALRILGVVLGGLLAILKVVGGLLAMVGSALWRLFRSLPGKIQIVVAVVLVLLLAFAAKSCVDAGASSQSANNGAAASGQEQSSEGEQAAETKTDFDLIDRTLLSDYLSEEELDSVIASAETNADVAWIAAHIDEYSDFGYEVQEKLLKLVAREPESVDFVRHYVEKAGSTDVQPCDPVEEGTVPLLIQWDTRWAYPDYSRFVIGLSGCGPTSMCMIYQGLTGESDKSPYDFATDAVVNDFVHSGTDAGFYSWEAETLGLTYEEIGVDADELASKLKKGNLVLCNVGPGDFTEVGHFIVITGVDDQGKLTINDPNSKVRSAKKWDINQVINQTQALMCFGKAA